MKPLLSRPRQRVWVGLMVGLYDPATVTRVGTAQGQDQVALPQDVAVTASDR